jgi:hypothetical protein
MASPVEIAKRREAALGRLATAMESIAKEIDVEPPDLTLRAAVQRNAELFLAAFLERLADFVEIMDKALGENKKGIPNTEGTSTVSQEFETEPKRRGRK